MFQNYLKTTFRHLMKHKAYALINIIGLATGVAACLVTWKYVEFELSYDNFHKNGDHLYRALFTDYVNGEKIDSSPRFGYGLGPALIEDLPEVETYVRTHGMGGDQAVISYSAGGRSVQFQEEGLLFADSTFLNIFTYEVVSGNGTTALDNPSSIVITESVSKRYFGDDVDAVGKTLSVFTTYWIKGDYVVTAVLKDVPQNSHLDFDFLIPLHNLLQIEGYQEPKARWDWVNFTTYVQMRAGTDVENVNAKTDALLTKYTGPNPPGIFIFTFQPVRDIHLSAQDETLFNSVYFYILISIVILVIAWINYVNMATARATERAREVGVKKALGVFRSQLVHQFFVESCVSNLVSIMLALVFAVAFLPLLGGIVDKALSFDFSQPAIWILATLLFVTGSAASGIYPAFVLASVRTTEIIKGTVEQRGNGFSFRRALVVFQFTASLLLTAGTFTIYRQVKFMQGHEKGMNMDQVLVVNGPSVLEASGSDQRLTSFKNELLQYASVKNVATSGAVPGAGVNLVTGMVRLGAHVGPNEIPTVYIVRVDRDFVKTYGIELIAGTSWQSPVLPMERSVLINEAALGPFGLGDSRNALNEKLVIDEEDTVSICGIFKNVHWNSLQAGHVPMLLWPHEIVGKHFSIQISGDSRQSVNTVAELYKKHFPGNPFEFFFLDDFFNSQYRAEDQFGQIFSILSLLAVMIACMGLAALASFTTRKRLKEISIRRVLGASASDIVRLLSGQFLKLIMVAGFISLPLTWYGMNAWLSNFAFRIDRSWDLFVLPISFLLVIALASVSFQIISAAFGNPAKNLRTE